MELEIVRQKMNRWGRQGRPFLFLFDFALRIPDVIPLDSLSSSGDILYDFQGVKNYNQILNTENKSVRFEVFPVSYARYCRAFSLVQKHIQRGDSFLLNLTMPSFVTCNLTLKEIFYRSKALYKIFYRNRFVCFSPEIFVQTDGDLIRSFPMKGTQDARCENAVKKLLSNQKELAEHFTIVDLIRNDLSRVARQVQVVRFRYIDRVKTHRGEILQMSSEIQGKIRPEFKKAPGDMLLAMLPAGSVSGAPKKKTLEIIHQAEGYNRGFYTGVMGIFDGKNIDSGVMIRFVEQTSNGWVYKSGGGITAQSNCEEEYRELIDKIYVPFA